MLNPIITPPRVPLVDPNTGLISRAWYLFFLSLNNVANAVVDDPVVGPSAESLIASYDALLQTLAQEVQTQPSQEGALDQIAELQKQIASLELQPRNELGTIATQNANAVAITGGTINNTVIGGTTPAAGTFTTLTATTSVTTPVVGAASGSTTTGLNLNVNSKPQATIIEVGDGTRPLMLNGGSAGGAAFAGVSASTGALTVSSNGGNPISFFTISRGNTQQFNVAHTTSAVNYVQVTGAATGGRPTISAQGSDAAVDLNFAAKGVGGIYFQQFSVLGASKFNNWTADGAVTGRSPFLRAGGGDTNVSATFGAKGTGAINLAPGSRGVNISNGGTVTAITRTSAGSGYTSVPSVALSAPTTAGGVTATATCTVGVATFAVAAGGTGYTVGNVLTVVGGTGTAATFTVATLSGSAVATVTSTNAGSYSAVPTNPASTTGGTGTGCTININTYAVTSGGFTITNAGSGYVEQPTVTFSGGGGSGAAAYASVGSGTVIRALGATGAQALDFHTAASATNTVPALRLRDVSVGTSNTGFLMVQNNNGYSSIIAQGPTNAALNVASNGTGVISFNTNSTLETTQMRVSHTASAVNYVQVTGAATGNQPVISTQGSDANVILNIASKGNAGIIFNANSAEQFRVGAVASAVNSLQLNGATTGNSPSLQARGTNTDIDVVFTPKGTGKVRFGTYTADMTLIVQGYIEVKDSGGTIRKLAVIA